jgi:hypothetical protein
MPGNSRKGRMEDLWAASDWRKKSFAYAAIQRFDPRYTPPERPCSVPKIHRALRVKPELRSIAKKTCQAKRHLRTCRPTFPEQFVNTLPSNFLDPISELEHPGCCE